MSKIREPLKEISNQELTQMMKDIKGWEKKGTLPSESLVRSYANRLHDEFDISHSDKLRMAEISIYREVADRWVESQEG